MDVIRYNSISSTNSILLELSKKDAKSWTVVWTSNQIQGRGYAGNEWKSEKDKNIAVSILIKSELTYESLIFYNQWVCNQVHHYLAQFSDEVFVKWPNDILIKKKKVCGILIETYKTDNKLFIITGVGLNVNQSDFEKLPKAGSLLTQTGQKYKLEEILSGLLTELERNYTEIENCQFEKISDEYNKYLFHRNKISVFEREGERFNGIIQSVNEKGQLVVKMENDELYSFNHKEIILYF
ncbi:MAG: biotin--[acetyl-CoA-carboxylase] ligase [Moheibacter sp.]